MISKVKFYRLCDEKFERYFRNVKIFRSNAIKYSFAGVRSGFRRKKQVLARFANRFQKKSIKTTTYYARAQRRNLLQKNKKETFNSDANLSVPNKRTWVGD